MAAGAFMREALEYHRDGVAAGELWRLLTGQLVHWSTAMLMADFAVLLVAGFLLARTSPRVLMLLCSDLSRPPLAPPCIFSRRS